MSAILVLNAGSSSLKFAAFGAEDLKPILRGQVSALGGDARFEAKDGTGSPRPCPAVDGRADHAAAQRTVLEWLRGQGLGRIVGTGHRIVHGGSRYIAPTIVNDEVEIALEGLRALAPVHLPFGLGALRRMREIAPRVPQVACFDTAFHASQPDVATWLPLPRRFHAKGYRRYGFHGLNYEHVVRALPKIAGAPLPKR
ncbi:MAG: acetate kinase, partial [Parvibaculaceae bacterium]